MGVKIPLDDIKNKLKSIFTDYEFDFSNFLNTHSKIRARCPIHGWNEQVVKNLLNGHGCRKCSYGVISDKQRADFQDILKKFRDVHGDKYDYSLFDYTKNRHSSTIICPQHGTFSQSAWTHMKGSGCSSCSGNKKFKKDDFVNKSNLSNLHTNNYDYTLVEYVNMHTPVEIICPKHGVFKQLPLHHVRGVGCAKCNQSLGERMIENYLKENKINYEFQKKFRGCVYKGQLAFDFYLPDYNTCIEFNGIQHYFPVDIFGGEKSFKLTVFRDNIKSSYCEKNNIRLIIIKQDKKYINIKDIKSQIESIISKIEIKENIFIKRFKYFS